MAEQAKPKIGNITKFFIPGLAIGLAVGGVVGAYFSSSLENPAVLPERKAPSRGAVPVQPEHPTGRLEDPPAAPAGETGATGATGTSGATAAEPAPK